MSKMAIGLMMVVSVAMGPTPARADGAVLGSLLGAGLGGYIGSQIGRGSGNVAATAAGIATGAVIGGAIGSASSSPAAVGGGYVYGGVPYGFAPYQPTYVAPPDTQIRVIYVPQPVYATGSYVGDDYESACKPYVQTLRVGGAKQETHGMACRQPDGSWRLQ